MIIEELKKYLRATILTGADVARREYALELLEKIIGMEIKLKSAEAVNIPALHGMSVVDYLSPRPESLDEHQP